MAENLGPDGAIVGVFEKDIASAATCDIGHATNANNLRLRVTGTTTITSFGTMANRLRILRFAGALTITHHGTSLICPNATDILTATGDHAIVASDASGNWRVINYFRTRDSEEWITIALSDKATVLAVGTNKAHWFAPFALRMTRLPIASVDTQQTSGSILTIDMNDSGTSMLSTKLTIDNNEDTSLTAATPAVFSDIDVAAGAKITFDFDQVGVGPKGAQVTIFFTRKD